MHTAHVVAVSSPPVLIPLLWNWTVTLACPSTGSAVLLEQKNSPIRRQYKPVEWGVQASEPSDKQEEGPIRPYMFKSPQNYIPIL